MRIGKLLSLGLFLLVVTNLTACLDDITGTDAVKREKITGNGISLTSDGTYIYFANSQTQTVLRGALNGASPTVIAGSGAAGNSDGTGTAATFAFPSGITHLNGKLYITQTGLNWDLATAFPNFQYCGIRVIDTTTLIVSTLASTGCGATDGATPSFRKPHGIANDGTDLYVADTMNHLIRKVTTAGVASTIAGTAGLFGSTDATGASARFKFPKGVVAYAGKLYVSDTGNHTIRVLNLATNEVTTLAGQSGVAGSSNGIGSDAQFSSPMGLHTTDGITLFVADSGNNQIRKIDIATGTVSTLAGTSGLQQESNGALGSALFDTPISVLLTSIGLFVSNEYNIRKIY